MTSIMSRNVLSVLALSGFLFLALGSADTNQKSSGGGGASSPSKQAQEPVVSVSATTLFADYEANEISADQKYKDKILLVSGSVEDIKKDILDTMYVTLKTSNSIFTIQCYFDDSNASKLSSLRKGQSVTVKGRCDGKFGNVMLKDCSLQ